MCVQECDARAGVSKLNGTVLTLFNFEKGGGRTDSEINDSRLAIDSGRTSLAQAKCNGKRAAGERLALTSSVRFSGRCLRTTTPFSLLPSSRLMSNNLWEGV